MGTRDQWTRTTKVHPLKPCIAPDCDGEMMRSDDARLWGEVEQVRTPDLGPMWFCQKCGELESIDPAIDWPVIEKSPR